MSNDPVGQVFTPDQTAVLLASMLEFEGVEAIRVLDPGAGHGALSEAVAARLSEVDVPVEFEMVEIDAVLVGALASDVRTWLGPTRASYTVVQSDFLDYVTGSAEADRFSHVIMNPPYSRITSNSTAQAKLRDLNVPVSNLYAAFMWLAADLVRENGQLVALVPRSFCNGAQFRALRAHLFDEFRLTAAATFEHRDEIFERDRVLQEVVAVSFKRTSAKGATSVSRSRRTGLTSRGSYPHESLVSGSPDYLIRLPDPSVSRPDRAQWQPLIGGGLEAWIGSVVDFREEGLSMEGGPERVPLVDGNYAGLSRRASPRGMRYIRSDSAAVLPPNNYVVVARVSPTERRPRVRAVLLDKEETARWGGVAFENHVVVIGKRDGEFPYSDAIELIEVLGSSDLDAQFRELSGSTQVNLSDLRALRRPPR